MRMSRKFAMAAVAAGMLTMSAPAIASANVPFGQYNANRTGSTEFVALYTAENAAYHLAYVHGQFERYQCHQVFSNVRQLSPYLYDAQVTVHCYR